MYLLSLFAWQFLVSLSDLFRSGAYGTPGKANLTRRQQVSVERLCVSPAGIFLTLFLQPQVAENTGGSSRAQRLEAELQQERNKQMIVEKARAKYSDVRIFPFMPPQPMRLG